MGEVEQGRTVVKVRGNVHEKNSKSKRMAMGKWDREIEVNLFAPFHDALGLS